MTQLIDAKTHWHIAYRNTTYKLDVFFDRIYASAGGNMILDRNSDS